MFFILFFDKKSVHLDNNNKNMVISLKKTKQAFDILENYSGENPYIKLIKKEVLKNNGEYNDFMMDYVLKNHEYKEQILEKVVKIADWFAEKKKEQWGINFLPQKVQIKTLLGETDNTYHVYLKYKQNQEKPVQCFIPKDALWDDLFVEDFKNKQIDFSKYEKENRKLFEHQKDGVKFLLTRKKCLLADDAGLGKTTQLSVASLEGDFKKILVICPASLKTNWKRELGFYAPQEEIVVINGDEWISDKKFTIINYDIVDRYYKIPKEKNGKKEVISRKKEVIEKCLAESKLIQANFDLIIIDEAHKLSNNTSNRFKTISDFLKRSKIKDIYLVTGTPITNKPINYYNIMSLINHPITLNWEKFIKRYCEGRKRTSKTGGSFWEAKGASNLEELKEKTKNAYIRRMKDEIPGLPSKTIREIYYDLTEKERKEYALVWEEYVEKKKLEGQNSFNKDLTELILLRQFISKKMVSRTIEFINDKLEDDKKVFVACCFTDEINELKEYYGDKCVIYNGQMTQKQKDKAVYEFMNNDNVMVFCGNIIAAGVGLTLTSSHTCVYNSFEWVPGNNSQMCDRIHRISQTKDVEIYYQLFTNTISETIWNTVVKKEINIDKIIVKEDEK